MLSKDQLTRSVNKCITESIENDETVENQTRTVIILLTEILFKLNEISEKLSER